MKKLLLETSFSKIYIMVMIIITLLILGGYFSYAMFTVTKEKSNAISIVTGNLTYKLEVDEEESNIITIPKGTIRDYEVVLTNPNNRIARFNIAYKETEGVILGYLADSENIPPTSVGINLEKDGTIGSSNIYNLRVRNETSEDVEIELIVKVGLDYNDLTIDEDKRTIGKYEDISLKDYIMKLRNDADNRDYSTSSEYEQKQMYTFNHEVTEQQTSWSEDELTDYRYIGDNPNNYIEFNNELWRIIGVFTTEKQDGTKEQLVKIIKETHIADTTLSWDANADKTYKDIWAQAEVNKMLNGAYLNSSTMTYYNYQYRTGILTTVNLDFREEGNGTETGLSNVSDMIEPVKWYTSSYKFTNVSDPEYVKLSVDEMYASERGTLTVSGGSPNFIGKIALLYPSDYGYTVGYNYNISCYNKPYANTNCTNPRTWIFSNYQSTITTLSMGRNFIQVANTGLVSTDSSRDYYILPTLYLTSNIIVKSGNGTKENHFILSVN